MKEDSGSLEQGIPKGTLWMTQDSLKYDCIVLFSHVRASRTISNGRHSAFLKAKK